MTGSDSKRLRLCVLVAALSVAALAGPAWAPRAGELDSKPARDLFGAVRGPTTGTAKPIGFFSKGCLAGASELSTTGDDWQVMRPSRNRNWGMPVLVKTIEAYRARRP